MDRVGNRPHRFEDQNAYRRVLDPLTGLYPTRPVSEFEVALRQTMLFLSESALDFLRKSSSIRRPRPSSSARTLHSDIRSRGSGDWTHDKASWED